jgi:general secretion pathway protein N
LRSAGRERPTRAVTAREIRGSIWSGELAEARLGALPLGTVRASLSPLALLGGGVELVFSRTDERLGALAGRLHGSDPRGMSDVNGTTSMSGGLGSIPVDTIRFEGATVVLMTRANALRRAGASSLR